MTVVELSLSGGGEKAGFVFVVALTSVRAATEPTTIDYKSRLDRWSGAPNSCAPPVSDQDAASELHHRFTTSGDFVHRTAW